MDEEERQKLIAYRKQRQKEKELEHNLHRDLRSESLRTEMKSIREQHQNQVVTGAIIFFGTLFPLYLFLFGFYFFFNIYFATILAMVGIDLGWLPTFLHAVIWTASIISVYLQRSVLDMILDRVT